MGYKKKPEAFFVNFKCSKCGHEETIGIIKLKNKTFIGSYYEPKIHFKDELKIK